MTAASGKAPSVAPDLVVEVVDSALGRCLGLADETEREAYLAAALLRLLRAAGEVHDEHDHDAGRGVQRALREVLRRAVGSAEPPDDEPPGTPCAWCGRAIELAPDGVTWLAVKAAERGYDPNFCEAVADGFHDPTDEETTR